MVRPYGVADFGLLLILLSKLGTEQCVREFGVILRDLAYIVEESGALGELGVQTELRSKNRADVGNLAGVLQKVLPTISGYGIRCEKLVNSLIDLANEYQLSETLEKLEDMRNAAAVNSLFYQFFVR